MLQSSVWTGDATCPQCLHPMTPGSMGDRGTDGAKVPDAITVSDSLQAHGPDIPKQEQQGHPSCLTLPQCFERLPLPLPVLAPILSISSTWCSLGVWPQPPARTCDTGDFPTVILLSTGDAQPKPGRSAQ